MFKNIRTVKGVVAETAAYAADVKYYLEDNKPLFKGIGIGLLTGAVVVSVFKSRPVVVNNVINVCGH